MVHVATGVLVIQTGILTLQDGTQGIGPGKILGTGSLLVLLGTDSAMWGLHLSIVSEDLKM